MTKVTIKLRRGTSDKWSQLNPILGDGEIGIDQTTKLFKIGDGLTPWNELAYAILKGEDGEDGWAPRETALVTTTSLSHGSSEDLILTLTAGYRLLKIETDYPARVRVYDSLEKQTLDKFRPIGQDPKGNHGVILDFATTQEDLMWWLNPVVDGYVTDNTNNVPITVTNISGCQNFITLSLTWIRSE